VNEINPSRRRFLSSIAAVFPLRGISSNAVAPTHLYVEESGVFGGGGPFCIGVIAVDNFRPHERYIRQLRARYGYRSQLLYRSTDKFKLPLASAVCGYVSRTPGIAFSARVIGKTDSSGLSRGASEALYFDHYKKILSAAAARSAGYSVTLVNHAGGGRDELLRKFLKAELPKLDRIAVAHLRDSDLLQIANLLAGTVSEGDTLENKVKRSFALTLRRMLHVENIRALALQQNPKFNVERVEMEGVGQPKEAFRDSVTAAGRLADVPQTHGKSQGHISRLLESMKRNESFAIWLEAIALVAIFLLDLIERRDQRRERSEQHKETAAQLHAAQSQLEATTRSADAAKKSADLAAALNRPFMGLANIALKAGFNTRLWDIGFYLKNYGTLPAVNVGCTVEFFTDNHLRTQKTEPASVQIFPSAEVVSIIRFDMGDADKGPIHQETMKLLMKIRIPYRSEDGRQYEYSAEASFGQSRFAVDKSETRQLS
jgi:hypothetical protein